jgi:hypothetical protein
MLILKHLAGRVRTQDALELALEADCAMTLWAMTQPLTRHERLALALAIAGNRRRIRELERKI